MNYLSLRVFLHFGNERDNQSSVCSRHRCTHEMFAWQTFLQCFLLYTHNVHFRTFLQCFLIYTQNVNLETFLQCPRPHAPKMFIWTTLRDGKIPPHFGNLYCTFFSENLQNNNNNHGPKPAICFLDWKRPHPFPPLELFRKFIRFGSVTRPSQAWVKLGRGRTTLEWRHSDIEDHC